MVNPRAPALSFADGPHRAWRAQAKLITLIRDVCDEQVEALLAEFDRDD